jgi:hypothetical protein
VCVTVYVFDGVEIVYPPVCHVHVRLCVYVCEVVQVRFYGFVKGHGSVSHQSTLVQSQPYAALRQRWAQAAEVLAQGVRTGEVVQNVRQMRRACESQLVTPPVYACCSSPACAHR